MQLSRQLLAERGYIGHAETLNSSSWLPQRRQRVYMMFFLATMCAQRCIDVCLEVTKATQVKTSLDMFLLPDGLAAETKHAGRPKVFRADRGTKWLRHTLSFIKGHSLQPKILSIMKKGLERCPAFHTLTLREQRLLVCRLAFIWQKHQRLGRH